jgi:hypothetical protein
MENEVKYKLDLGQYSPNDIISWHKQGILTMEEIIDSGRMNSEFGDTLKNYIYECTSITRAKEMYDSESSKSFETRMATMVDRKIRLIKSVG